MNIVILRDIIQDPFFDIITDIISENPTSLEIFRQAADGSERQSADGSERIAP